MNATGLKNYKNELLLASGRLRVAAAAISILALTCSGDMTVLRRVNTYNKTCLVIQIRQLLPSRRSRVALSRVALKTRLTHISGGRAISR